MSSFYKSIIFIVISFLPIQIFANKPKIITIDGYLTETVFALNAGDQVIATDDTSYYPRAVHKLKKVGYMRSLNAEGILSLEPDLIIASDGIKPPIVIKQLKQSRLQVELFPAAPSVKNIKTTISKIGDILERKKEAKRLLATIDENIKQLEKIKTGNTKKPLKAVFALTFSKEATIAGKGTKPTFMLEFSGAEVPVSFYGWKTLNAETAIAINPDVIFFMDTDSNPHTRSRLTNKQSIKKITSHQGFAHTNAVKNNRIIALDYTYFFTMGPRFSKAALDLHKKLYP